MTVKKDIWCTSAPSFTLSRLALVMICLCMVFFLASCASTPKSTVRGTSSYTIRGETYYPLETGEGYSEEGEASWYGPGFHGKTTANGERYNQNAMTAAHKTLPLGTDVRVTHLENGKSIEVRINDRGPFAHGRIIDLSKRAAEKLDMKDAGTASVRVEAISENGEPFAGASGAYGTDDGPVEEFSEEVYAEDDFSDDSYGDYTEDSYTDEDFDDDYADYEEEESDGGFFGFGGPKRKKRTLSDGPGGAVNKKTLF